MLGVIRQSLCLFATFTVNFPEQLFSRVFIRHVICENWQIGNVGLHFKCGYFWLEFLRVIFLLRNFWRNKIPRFSCGCYRHCKSIRTLCLRDLWNFKQFFFLFNKRVDCLGKRLLLRWGNLTKSKRDV